MSYKA
jgi:ABC-type multidrug transport system fused ATPase/permease subunit